MRALRAQQQISVCDAVVCFATLSNSHHDSGENSVTKRALHRIPHARRQTKNFLHSQARQDLQFIQSPPIYGDQQRFRQADCPRKDLLTNQHRCFPQRHSPHRLHSS